MTGEIVVVVLVVVAAAAYLAGFLWKSSRPAKGCPSCPTDKHR